MDYRQNDEEVSFCGLEASEASAAHGLDGGLADVVVEVAQRRHDELVQQGLQRRVQFGDLLASQLEKRSF
jgi:hypothetical protein